MKSVFKIYYSSIAFIMINILCTNSIFADDSNKVTIEGELDIKKSDLIVKEIEKLKADVQEIQAETYKLQNLMVSQNKNSFSLVVHLKVNNEDQKNQFGIVNLFGSLNHNQILNYDHPLILEKNENYPLFEGVLPLGKYVFNVDTIVGQQIEKWPFVLPEGKWSLDKSIEIDCQNSGEKRVVTFSVSASPQTGLPVLDGQLESVLQ